jgi:acetyl-CoA carboxylase beta subunit
VFYFFKEKNAEFCYLPNCRTLKTIRTQDTLSYSASIQALIDKQSIAKANIDSILTYGDVNFSKSKIDRSEVAPNEHCNTYYIDGYINNEPVELVVYNCKFSAEVKELNKTEQH